MSNAYTAYLLDSAMDPLNNTVGVVEFRADDLAAAQHIAEARFAEELKDPNKFLDIQDYGVPSGPVIVNLDDEE